MAVILSGSESFFSSRVSTGITSHASLALVLNGAFYFSQACFEDVFNFSRNKLMIPIVLFQSLWMFC